MAKNKYVYGCDDCGRNIDPSEPNAVMYKVTVTRETAQTLGPDEDGNTVACMLPEPLGNHPQHVAKRTRQLCERCVGSDVVRRFSPPTRNETAAGDNGDPPDSSPAPSLRRGGSR